MLKRSSVCPPEARSGCAGRAAACVLAMRRELRQLRARRLLTAFSAVLPLPTVARVWDSLLLTMDSTVLFRAMLAIMELNTPQLLACDEPLALWQRLAAAPQLVQSDASLLDATHWHYASLT